MSSSETSHHPELRGDARFLPRGVVRSWSLGLLRRLNPPAPRLPAGVTATVLPLPGTSASVRVVRAAPRAVGPQPVVLWMHGGGFVIGNAAQDDLVCAQMAQRLGAVVVSVDYRLATDHPYPAPLDDCAAAWALVHEQATQLGVDPTRLIIAGLSAGAGLAAGLVVRLAAEKKPLPLLQVLVYPMLDDRTTLRPFAPEVQRMHRLWDHGSNVIGWTHYLGRAPGGDDVPAPAAPARTVDVRGLPPTWIGVGTLDLFHGEDVAYAARLREAGVPTELEIVPGAFHGFDAVLKNAPVSVAFVEARLRAMDRALGVEPA